MRRIFQMFLLACLSGMGGCAMLAEQMAKPEISLVEMAIVQASLTEQQYRLTFRVDNPNPVALPVAAVDYRVSLEGSPFATGSTDRAFTVPARGGTTFAVTVRTDLLRTLREAGDWLEQGPLALDYAVHGNLRLENFLRSEIPFRREGEIRLTR